jgi:hypothetical protein
MNRTKSSTAGVTKLFAIAILGVIILAVWGHEPGYAKYGGAATKRAAAPDDIPYALTGHVTYDDGTRAANVTVEMYGTDSGTASTDGEGNFHFTLPYLACVNGAHAVSFKATLPDPSCPNNVRRDYCPFGPCGFFSACGDGGAFEAGTLTLEKCQQSPAPPQTPQRDDTGAPRCPRPTPTPTDTTFVTTASDTDLFSPKGVEGKNVFRSQGPFTIEIPVSRVVGEVDVDHLQTLKYPEELVNNGVVSREATLTLAYYDVDSEANDPASSPERDHITFNGVEIGASGTPEFLPGKDKEWTVKEYKIPISLVRFGRKRTEAGLPSGSPLNGYNEVKITVDEANAGSGKERWGMSVAWASIQFSALAPVILVHGNNSCGDFFAGDINVPCGSMPRMAPSTTWFIQAFKDKKIPYDNSINLSIDTPAEASINAHGAVLATKIPEIARTFGAKHVHIVAHSKGGLDTREFLTRITPGSLGVMSLTTLSTPHGGSVAAEYELVAADAVRRNQQTDLTTGKWEAMRLTAQVSERPLRAAAAVAFGPNYGTPFLSGSAARAFTARNKGLLPRSFTVDGVDNKMYYYAIAADANLDDSHEGPESPWKPTISADETKWLPGMPLEAVIRGEPAGSVPTDWAREQAYQLLYDMLGRVRTVGVYQNDFGRWGIDETRFPNRDYFRFNDFCVTHESGVFNPVRELGFNRPPEGIGLDNGALIKAHHGTLSSVPVANIVIQLITHAQPME